MRLRPLTADDWPAVHEWARLPEACRYQAWGPNAPEETRAYCAQAEIDWRHRPRVRLAHAVTLDGRVIGSADLHSRGTGVGEIGYGIHPDFWGHGVATQAGRLMLRIGFGELRLHRIYATCDPRNIASGRVLVKLGMKYEGRMRETVLIRDGWRDSDLYAILQPEWAADR